MRKYELAVIFNAKDDASALKEKMKAIVSENGGTDLIEDDWGVRKLAYPIKKQFDGYYYFLKFSSEPAGIKGIKKTLYLEEELLRYLILLDEHKHVFKRKNSSKSTPSKIVDEIKKEIPHNDTKVKNAPSSESNSEE